MDEEQNPENTEEDIEFLEDDFVEVVDLDGGGEIGEGTKQLYQVECTWRFDLNSKSLPEFNLTRSQEQRSCKVISLSYFVVVCLLIQFPPVPG